MEVLCAVVLCLLPMYVAGHGQGLNTNSAWSYCNVSYNSVVLNCPNHTDWFHVTEEISYVDGNCTTGETSGAASIRYDGKTQLSVNCIGRQANTNGECKEVVDVCKGLTDNNKKNNILKVNYECITDVMNYNICENITNQRVATGVVYLASANLFRNTSSSTKSRLCQCRVSGVSVARALYVAVRSRLNVSCANCSNSGPFPNQEDTLINEQEYFSNTSSATLHISFNQSVESNVSENSAWIQVTGNYQLVLQCNEGLETLTSPTECASSDISTTTFSSSETSSNYIASSTSSKTGIYLYIIGAIAGTLLLLTLIITAVVVVCKMRRKQELKKNPTKVVYSSTNPDPKHDAGGYCVIDTNREKGDNTTSSSKRKKSKWLKWRQSKAEKGTTEKEEPTRLNNEAGKDGVTPLSMQPPLLSTAPVAACTKGLTNLGFSNDGEDRKVYHILAPDPDAPQEKDIAFLHVPRGAGPARIQQSSNVFCDPNPRERSVYLYSDVEDIDGASGGEAKTGPSDKNPVQSLQNPKSQMDCSNQRKEYEEVMASDLRSSQNYKARVSQRDKSNEYQEIMAGDVQPSHNPETRIHSQDKSNEYQEIMAVGEPSKVYHILEPDPDALPERDIVIVPVNPLAHVVTGADNSTRDYMHKGVEEASGGDLEDDDDELVMIDNILYKSSDPESQTQHQHKAPY